MTSQNRRLTMKDNQAKYPQLRFKGFTDPWEQRKLGNLGLNISDGDWIEKQHIFENGQYRIIQTGNIGVDEYLDKPQNAKYFRQEDFNQLKANEIFPGDIVVCRLADPAGRAVILPNIGKQMVTSVDVAILRPSSRISFRFLVSQLNNPRNLKQVQIMASGSTRTRISRKNLEREIIQLPNINEQKKIGSFFSILNSTIALHQRKLAKLKELKQGYLQKLFPKNGSKFPQLRFSGFADAWEQRKLGEVGKTQSGIGFPDAEQGGTEGVPFYKVSDMNKPGNEHEMVNANNYVNYEQLSRKKWKIIETVPAVIFAKVGAAIMLNRKRLVTSPFLIDNNTMAYVFDGSWNIDFGKTLFETINLPRYAQVGALPSYNGSDIESIEVTLPNKGEQVKLGAFFKSLDDTITLHKRKLEKLQELKKGYLQKMFC